MATTWTASAPPGATGKAPHLPRNALVFVAIAAVHVGAFMLLALADLDRPAAVIEPRTISAALIAPTPAPAAIAAPVAAPARPVAPPRPRQATPPMPHPTPRIARPLPTPGTPAVQATPMAQATPVAQASPPSVPQPAPSPAPAVVASEQAPAAPARASSDDPKAVRHLSCTTVSPEYPAMARRRGETGTTEITMIVGLRGEVESATVRRSSGSDRLDEAARAAALASVCQPTLDGGQPVRTTANVSYRFNLDD
jgi:protein TonB